MTDLTPEQKLDEIYSILKHQETRRKVGIWYRIFKWVIVMGIVWFIAANPTFLITKLTDIMMPIITENMKTMMEDKQSTLMESVKNMLPKNNSSDTSSTPSPY